MSFPKLTPMLCTLVKEPPSDEGWIFEDKYDGERALAYIESGKLKLYTRNWKEVAFRYPELGEIVKAIKSSNAILDGEIVALNDKKISSFQILQQRIGLQDESEITEMAKKIPVFYIVFDILYLDGKSIMEKPWEERRKILEKTIKTSTHIKLSEYKTGDGKKAFEAAEKAGLEGIVAKKKDSPCQAGVRGQNWLKIKATNEQETVIAGWTEGYGARKGSFGSLILGLYDKNNKLKYVGNVGTGFDQVKLFDIMAKLKKIATPQSPFANFPKLARKIFWVKPHLVVQIKFAEWTTDSQMRQPVFLGFRDDKKPKECKFEK